MYQNSNDDLLQRAETLAEEGQYREARSLVKQVIRNDNRDPVAWWALTQLASSDAERRRALEEVLKLEPAHPHAQHMRDQLLAGTLPSIDTGGQAIPNLKPRKAKDTWQIEPRNFLMPAIYTLIVYWIFWLAGLALNIYYLREARHLTRETGMKQPNSGCLWGALIFNVLPILGAIAYILLFIFVADI